MTEYGKAQIQALGAGLGGFVVVVGAGAALMLHHGGSAVKAPAAVYAPVDVTSALSAPATLKSERTGAPLGAPSAVASSPAPLLPASDPPAQAAAAAPSAAPAAVSPRPVASAGPAFSRKLVVSRHLDGTSSATSSARATVAAAKVKPAARRMKKPFLTPKLDLSKTQSALASSIHYGVSDRSELMGRAAGPVYNFSGRNAQAQQIPQGTVSGAIQQVDAAQQQIDNSSLDASDKAALNQNLGQVRQAVQTNGGGQ